MAHSTPDEGHGEILEASGPGAAEIQVGMDVVGIDGEAIGRVKAVGDSEFLVDRPLARDVFVPFAAVLVTSSGAEKFRGGPAQADQVRLSVSAAHVDDQGWRHP